jgi:aminoglycoside phosphotransferase family enzyme/predicted kinase
MPASDLPPLVIALLDPAAYSHPVEHVELRQTHISNVFMAGDYVYKVKKPVDFGFLNYSTLSRRRYYCHQEVKLNSRLCSGTYLGVVPIREAEDGAMRVNGPAGKVVEYAVWMRRLPDDRMMHKLLDEGRVTPQMVSAVAEKLLPFHQSAETSPAIARYGDWAIRYNCTENVEQWQPYIGRTITAEQDAILRAYLEAFYSRKADVMARRVEESRIRRCHSDLRSDAVCFIGGGIAPADICIFDCVEFSRRITLVDTARDVSFLAMDLEYRGYEALAETFVRRYEALAHDSDLETVLPFYACYNACVRGKVEGFLLDVPGIPEPDREEAAVRARGYFDLAVKYARSLPPAMLVITCGLSASGKSSLAKALRPRLDADVLSSDMIRKRIAGLDPGERAGAAYRAGIYSPEMSERTYEALMDEARPRLLAGRSVILDAAFLRRDQRKLAVRMAKQTGAQFACVVAEAAEQDIRQRMAARLEIGSGPSDADWTIYVQQKRRFQRPGDVPAGRLFSVDTSGDSSRQVEAVVQGLRGISPLSVPAVG